MANKNAPDQRPLDEILKGITPVKVGNLAAFVRAVEPILGSLQEQAADGDGVAISFASGDVEHVIDATVIGADVDRGWLNEQNTDVLIKLASRVFEVNIEFF